ncbi:FtsH protease activity modulator HflK [Massilia glaciei]|uniref:Protein HflK n=1 Tax=Massilia glaciei TaxID=1524097 RepID=A0A2U2I4F6_9BURK|nr:FtsH protease activity modulator HflK [Massilia glaciei]PWF54613.1 FtsH protease activity modulator HflK [Massilia glaciei]
MLVSLFKRFGIISGPKAQESKKPGEGPPDLDQMWRDFNARLNRLFGPKGPGDNGGGGGPNLPDMKGAGVIVMVIGVVIALIWLASGTFSVRQGQAAVVTTFGQLSHTAGPGLNWRFPAPFQAHETVNVSQVRTTEVGYAGKVQNKKPQESLMLTDDQNIIDIQFAVQYTLKDPVAWLFNNRNQEDTVKQVAESSIREVVGKSKMDFVLYEGREKVAKDVHALMQVLIDKYKLGAQVTNVTMQGVQPPEQVQSAFDDAVRAGQDSARAKNEGEAYANQVIPVARGNAFRLMQEAEAYRAMVVANATGNAARFSQIVTEYQKAPAVTRDRMYLDAMQSVFTNASKVMIDAKSGSNLLYLPLDKLIAQTAANDAAVGAKSGPVQPAPAASEAVQSLEQVRQRDMRSREATRDREAR